MGKERKRKLWWRTVAVLAVGGLAGVGVWFGRQGSAGRYSGLLSLGAERTAVGEEDAARVAAFCGDCHTVPRPESFPRDAWDDEVGKGYEQYARSGRNDLDAPPMGLVKSYYRWLAPERIEFSATAEGDGEFGATFSTEHFSLGPDVNVTPAISHLRWASLEGESEPVLLVCDMRDGGVTAITLGASQAPPERLARLNNPAHVEPCDLDGDGAMDL
ncbi:MAG: hypothetical protein ACYC6Y_26990, partial [Thermoguttaceae bacterium]